MDLEERAILEIYLVTGLLLYFETLPSDSRMMRSRTFQIIEIVPYLLRR